MLQLRSALVFSLGAVASWAFGRTAAGGIGEEARSNSSSSGGPSANSALNSNSSSNGNWSPSCKRDSNSNLNSNPIFDALSNSKPR